jgi:hypothetical protein
MPIKSDELDSLFNKIILKLCTSTKNITNHPMPLEFLREEIQLSICISTALELKIIFNRLVQFSFQAEDYNILIDYVIRLLVLSSKQRLAIKLGLIKKNTFKKLSSTSIWLIKYLEFEEYASFVTIVKWIQSSKRDKNTLKSMSCLIENLIIKMSNVIVYELFSNRKISRVFLYYYVVDFAMFNDSLINLKFYFYWRNSIGNVYLNIRKLYTCTYFIFICTKDGFLLKKIYSQELIQQGMISKIYNPVIDFLKFLDYLFYKR